MKKMIIVASVLLVLGFGAGVFGFMAFNQAGVDERYARAVRATAAEYMGRVDEESTRKSFADANEASAEAEGQRTLGWVSVGGAVTLVGAAGVLFTLSLRKRASDARTDPNVTVVARHV
ncbi:hypothetical protein [Nonomuraea sp. NPDC049709]|uniref:hypothetical protein n=1 Tax=Nonomuraea sp. NPDC049709 TaxID=3154736 RepID=UPI003448FCE5